MKENPMSLEETLLPALVQCFGIMLLGYVLGRLNVLSERDVSGLSKFVRYLALPSLVFTSISTMPFSHVKWEFLASVFVSKAIVFVCVFLMTMLLTHPANMGKSGIFAIAATQSNVFALGYPLFSSLYNNSHPDFPSYMYIIAPIQLLVLNTIGFIVIETEKQEFDQASKCHMWSVFKRTLKNPVVIMTIAGMVWNVSFGNKMLPIFNSLLQTLSAAFPATALLLVGHTMATKGKSDNQISITVALIILTKNLILPIILQKVSTVMLRGSSDNEIQSFSSFAFLYGCTPTAPTVYVFAVQYDVCVDVITKSIIGSTLLSAPMMFASATVISLSQAGMENFMLYLKLTVQYLSCGSFLCCSWLLFSFIVGKRFRNISFGVTTCIFLAQFLTSIGGILLFFPVPESSVNFYIQYILSMGGIYATRVFNLLLAVLLFMTRWRSLCYILQIKNSIKLISVFCLILPFFTAALALLLSNIKSEGTNHHLAHIQNIITLVITLICLVGIILCLVLQHIYSRNESDLAPQRSNYESVYQAYSEDINTIEQLETARRRTSEKAVCSNEITVDVEDIAENFEESNADSENLLEDYEDYLCRSQYCNIQRRLECPNLITEYQNIQKETGFYDDRQIFQHTTLLLTISVAMCLSITVCLWKLMMQHIDGIFIELEFLDTISNYGFGILLFLIFGFNKGLTHTISSKWKALRNCFSGNNTQISSPDICHEFKTKYERDFLEDICNLRESMMMNRNLFCKSDLIQWIQENEIVKNHNQIERYILSLQEGHVIETVDKSIIFSEHEIILRLTLYET